MLQGLSEGRIVHYVLGAMDVVKGFEEAIGAHRAAVVVNAWAALGRDDGYANLLVFPDGSNDGVPLTGNTSPSFSGAPTCGLLWVTSRTYSESAKPGTWHWPERA